jgi:hypothetical protein
MIIVTLVGVTVQKKNTRERNFWGVPQEERKMIAATPCEDGAAYTDIRTSYTKFKTSSDVVNEEKIPEMVANKNSIPKNVKSWRGRLYKMPGSTNPRTLYNILRPLPMGEPYFIQ